MKKFSPSATFRRRVAKYFFFCITISAILASIASYVVSNSNVLEEVAASERSAAVYLLALEQKTDLPQADILAMASTSSIRMDAVTAEATELTEEQLNELSDRLILTVGGSLYSLPITYVQSADGLVAVSATSNYNQLHASVLRFVFSILFFVAAMAIGGRLISGKVASPIASLQEATQRIAQGDFTVRLPAAGDDELNSLMRNFNDMVEALARTEYLQKDFISNVSHEFKTPIASIQGFAKLLQSPELDEESRREYTDIIAEESERLSHLSRNLLRLSSLDRLPTTEAAPFALDEQLRRVVVQLEPTWEPLQIDWELDLSPTTLTAHEELLAEVWINLISNAIKFSPQGGVIQISCYATDQVFVEVTDHGCGMDEQTQRRIFDRFYQGDTSHSREGSGLGLCIAKKIVTQSGGEIQVRSIPGKGSTFRVTLPLTPAPAAIIPQEV